MAFKSYSWSIGTTSFRVSQLNGNGVNPILDKTLLDCDIVSSYIVIYRNYVETT